MLWRIGRQEIVKKYSSQSKRQRLRSPSGEPRPKAAKVESQQARAIFVFFGLGGGSLRFDA